MPRIHIHLIGVLGVVEFHQPSAGVIIFGERVVVDGGTLVGGKPIAHHIVGIGKIDTRFGEADGFGEEIQPYVVAIENHFAGLVGRRPRHSRHATHFKSGEIAHKSTAIVGVRHQRKVFAAVHTQQSGFLIQFYAIGFFVESPPGVVAAPLDLEWQRTFRRADSFHALHAPWVEVVGAYHIRIL